MSEPRKRHVAGLEPWLPWPLRSWAWWTRPVRAERLAALRTGMAACLLVDLLTSYRSRLADFFGDGGLGGARLFASCGDAPKLNWSLLQWIGEDEPWLLAIAFWAWVAATLLLLAGVPDTPGGRCLLALSLSFANANPHIDNAGDALRGITLFYLMLCPCGAAWSVDRHFERRRQGTAVPAYVWPWALRLLFIQLILIYFMNGLYKMTVRNWRKGHSLYYALGDLTLTRFSIAQLPVPLFVMRISTWLVLIWELSFPVLVIFRSLRWLALGIGVAFHLGILATMELGGFVPYMLCLYLPLLPWHKWLDEDDPTEPVEKTGTGPL